MDDWNRFCAGTAAALPQFHEHVRHLAGQIADLHHDDLTRLARLIVDVADAMRKAPLAHNEAIGLEVATRNLAGWNFAGQFPASWRRFRRPGGYGRQQT